MDEIKWIEFLKRAVKNGHGVIKGIGDDCALVSLRDKKLLLKSDLCIENIHFKRNTTPLKTVGMRAVARVVSDFAACGGKPLHIGISLGFPAGFKDRQLKEILSGVLTMTKKYQCSLVGGDTAKSKLLFLDVWGVGSTRKFLSRGGACIQDYIFVTGRIGARSFTRPFEPRVKEAVYLAQNFKINSMIDISDGFALDLHRLLKESQKGALLYKKWLPLTRGLADIYRGEDYELIFTVDRREKRIEELKKKFYCIGFVAHKRLGCIMLDGKKLAALPSKGYIHF